MDALPFTLPPIRLTELDATAALRTRFDHKYLFDDHHLALLLPVLLGGTDWRVLTIDDKTEFVYSTLYFDRDLVTLRDHQRGRRRRFKVRARSYSTEHAPVLEVKTKTGRGQTDKRRRQRSGAGSVLEQDEARWVDEQLGTVGIPAIASTLEASLSISYRRATLVDPANGERLTIDRGLMAAPVDAAGRPGGGVPVLPGTIIVEVKSGRPRTTVTRLLQQHRHRPMRLSKYCLGHASVDESLDRGMLRSATRESVRLADRVTAG
ncbi:MAG: hypothetical protein RLZZ01_251 [Actinomycetota bacterium]